MRRFMFVFLPILVLLFVWGCSESADEDSGTVSLIFTDSATSVKDGMTFSLRMGVDTVALGYVDENGDTIWNNLLQQPETLELSLKMQERERLAGCDSVEVENHPYQFLKIVITPPVVMIDTLDISPDYDNDHITIMFTFSDSIDIANEHVDFVVDFHSDKWLDAVNMSMSYDDMKVSMTCSIEE